MGVGRAFIDTKICAMQRWMADLIWGAVPQRYPRLRFVLVERRYWVGGLSVAVDGLLVGRSSSLDGAEGR
jgi:hypothetical protein